MSLKAVHFVFVTVLTALAVGGGVWKLRGYSAENGGNAADLWWGIGWFAAALVVVVYGWSVFKKLKSVGCL